MCSQSDWELTRYAREHALASDVGDESDVNDSLPTHFEGIDWQRNTNT